MNLAMPLSPLTPQRMSPARASLLSMGCGLVVVVLSRLDIGWSPGLCAGGTKQKGRSSAVALKRPATGTYSAVTRDDGRTLFLSLAGPGPGNVLARFSPLFTIHRRGSWTRPVGGNTNIRIGLGPDKRPF